MTQNITPDTLNQAMSYAQYRALIDNLLSEGKTTGPNQSPDYTEYTKMNVQRMKRLDKTTILNESLKKTLDKQPQSTWLILTEGWCGDAAQVVPIIQMMSEYQKNIETKYILRDEHLDIMNEFLTDGSKSIPKVIFLDQSLKVLDSWGPRPKEAQELMLSLKGVTDWKEVSTHIHKWYADDKTQGVQNEFEELLNKLVV